MASESSNSRSLGIYSMLMFFKCLPPKVAPYFMLSANRDMNISDTAKIVQDIVQHYHNDYTNDASEGGIIVAASCLMEYMYHRRYHHLSGAEKRKIVIGACEILWREYGNQHISYELVKQAICTLHEHKRTIQRMQRCFPWCPF